eukprot:751829-Prorocentrum_minimum.AAC.1
MESDRKSPRSGWRPWLRPRAPRTPPCAAPRGCRSRTRPPRLPPARSVRALRGDQSTERKEYIP